MQAIVCQPDLVWEDKPATMARVRAMLAEHPIPPGALLVLPEMFATGFSMRVEATAEPPGGPIEQFLHELARTHDCCVLGGLVAEWQGAPRNQALAVAPDGRVLARYTKQHPFSPAREAESFPAGGETVVFDWAGFRIAPFICYDLRFPEVFRRATAAGATLLAVIANWPSPRHHHWRTLLTARAIENQAAVIGVNRAGRDPGHSYAGGSLALDAQGHPLAEADDGESVLTVELDPSGVAAWRHAFPALRDAGYL
jgi:predicted amidohydrolase